jgi:DNA polymerase-1
MYGAGVRSLRKAFGVSQDEARAILRRYHAAHPEVSKLQQDMQWVLQDRGYVKTAWGRRQRIDPMMSYIAVNAVIQGTAADIIKEAAVELDRQGYPIIGIIHDEIILEVDKADAPAAAHDLEQALIDHPRITEKIPLAADVTTVERWSQAKDPAFTPGYALLK